MYSKFVLFLCSVLSLNLFFCVPSEASTKITINVKVYEQLESYDAADEVPTFSQALKSLKCESGIWVEVGFKIRAINEKGSTAGIGRVSKVTLESKNLYWEYDTDNDDEPTGGVNVFGFCNYSGTISGLRPAQFYTFEFDNDAVTDQFDVNELKKKKWVLNLGPVDTGWGEGPKDYGHKSLKTSKP